MLVASICSLSADLARISVHCSSKVTMLATKIVFCESSSDQTATSHPFCLHTLTSSACFLFVRTNPLRERVKVLVL
jgi:hypothetical protein